MRNMGNKGLAQARKKANTKASKGMSKAQAMTSKGAATQARKTGMANANPKGQSGYAAAVKKRGEAQKKMEDRMKGGRKGYAKGGMVKKTGKLNTGIKSC